MNSSCLPYLYHNSNQRKACMSVTCVKCMCAPGSPQQEALRVDRLLVEEDLIVKLDARGCPQLVQLSLKAIPSFRIAYRAGVTVRTRARLRMEGMTVRRPACLPV